MSVSERDSSSIIQQRLPCDGQAGRRNRPVHACEECRWRKIRCDRRSPCCHCILSQKTCLFKMPIARRHSQAVPVSFWKARARSSDAQATDYLNNGRIEITMTGSLHPDPGGCTAVTFPNTEVKGALNCDNAKTITDQPHALDQAPGSGSGSLESLFNDLSDYNVSETATGFRASLEPKFHMRVLGKSRLFGYSHWSTCNEVCVML